MLEQHVNRAEQLQFLRFCAFGLIFLWHANTYAFSFFPKGNGAANGVCFFILLGGFVSGYSSYNKDIHCSGKEVLRYMRKKLEKLYPLYFATTIFTISYSGMPSLVAFHSFSNVGSSLKQLLRNLLLIQSWFPSNYFSFNGVGWFLSTIMFLYLLNIPLRASATKIKKLKNANVYFSAIFFISFILIIIYCYLLRDTNLEYTEYVLPVSRIGEYICGMALGYLIFNINNKLECRTYIRILFSVLEIASLSLWIYEMYVPHEAWQFRIVHWLIPNCFLLIIFGFGKGIISSIFQKRLLKYLGDISFECFLLHQIVIHEYKINSELGAVSKLGNAFSILFCLCITILIASLITNRNIHKRYIT